MTEIEKSATRLLQQVSQEEIERNLDDFESLLDILENPSEYAITEEDLELLNEISLKLSNIPDLAFFGKSSKKQVGRRAQNSH